MCSISGVGFYERAVGKRRAIVEEVHMTGRTKRMVAIVGAVAASVGTGLVLVSAAEPSATEDCYATGSPLHCYNGTTAVTFNSTTNLIFTVGGLTTTCTVSNASGKPPAAGLKAINASNPVFSDAGATPCTDNAGGSDTTVTSSVHSKWQIKGVDKADGTAGIS